METSRSRYGAVGMALLAVSSATAAMLAGLGVPATASSQEPAPPPVTARADTTPRFIEPAAMPQGERFGDWGASAVRSGLPKRAGFCLDGLFKAEQTSYRPYSGSAPKVTAQEYLIQAGSATEAAELVTRVGKRLQGCYKEWLNLEIEAYRDAPRTASWERYRTSSVGDGLTVYGVFTVPPKKFDKATHLYGVGRDGDRVMVLHMSLVGSQAQSPDGPFRSSAAHALRIMR